MFGAIVKYNSTKDHLCRQTRKFWRGAIGKARLWWQFMRKTQLCQKQVKVTACEEEDTCTMEQQDVAGVKDKSTKNRG